MTSLAFLSKKTYVLQKNIRNKQMNLVFLLAKHTQGRNMEIC